VDSVTVNIDQDLEQVAAAFAVAITPTMADLIDPTDPNDPIARQFSPDARELTRLPAESGDPIGDGPHSPTKGLVHRYPDRALLKVVGACPVYCRFCFRREMVGPTGTDTSPLTTDELENAYAYIDGHGEIWEVILSGGDPLILAPRRLAAIVERLNAIPHLGVLRLHSRVPLVDPERISDDLLAALKGRLPVYVLLHANHAREFSDAGKAALKRLAEAGIPMLGQSVLLRGVNDDPAALTDLFRRMVENRVKPHYLHHGDLAPGTSHFRTTLAQGQALMRDLRGKLSGLCQPSYMLDIPGGHGKVPVGPNWLEATGEREWRVSDPSGAIHRYRDETA
jgi:lysine 2,3-aminomutase